MKVLNPQSPQTADVSRSQIVKSKLQGLKGFFRISESKDKSPFQYICMLVALGALFTCIFWHEGWTKGTVENSHIQAMALLVVIATGTYIGGRPTLILFLGFLWFCYASYFSISGKTPLENERVEKLPPYEHVIVFDKDSVGSPGHSKRFKHDRYLRVIVENGPVKAIFGNNVSVVLVSGQHPATVKKGEILGFESLGESKITIINDP
jgi:hypothetical protein